MTAATRKASERARRTEHGYKIERVTRCFGGHGPQWDCWLYRGYHAERIASCETKGEAMKAAKVHHEAAQ